MDELLDSIVDSPEEISRLRFFLSHEPTECQRLAQLFHEILESKDPIVFADWSDKTKDGTLKAPDVMAAGNSR